MKSYDISKPSQSSHDKEIIEEHKNARNGFLKKKPKVEIAEYEPEDEFDEIIIDNEPSKPQPVVDSAGNEIKINTMWKPKETSSVNDGIPIWQKPPSRMSTKEWILTLLLLLMPIINIILLFVWSFFSDSVPDEKKNFSRASISVLFIVITVVIIINIIAGGFKLNFIKNKASSTADSIKNYANTELYRESNDAQKNYDGLTDGDFSN